MFKIVSKPFCGFILQKSCQRSASSLKAEFNSFWPDVKESFLEVVKKNDVNGVNTNWFDKVLEYNLPYNGKQTQGVLTVAAFKSFSTDLTDKNLRLAHILGWCIEAFSFGTIAVLDDIQDESKMRYGQPAWHTQSSTAVNDALMIFAATHCVLQKHFHDKPYYTEILKEFNDLVLQMIIGQSLDMLTAKMDVLDYNSEFYFKMLMTKSTLFTMHLPINIAWHMASKTDSKALMALHEVLHEIGKYYQVENDFYDVFDDTKITSGKDIEQHKFSWLAVVANEKGTTEQKKILKECYGSKDPVKIQKCKDLFVELELPKEFEEYTKNYKQKVRDLSKPLPVELSKIVSNDFLHTLF